MKSVGIIPARYASTRFPGKPLAMIGNKSMIRRVYEKAKFSNLTEVIVATDDKRIMEHVESFGAKVIMTPKSIKNGTQRCAKAYEKLEDTYDVIVNIQGDEPFIEPKQINQLIGSFKQDEVEISTLIEKYKSQEEMESPHNIKVVVDRNDFALYFSRSPIPFVRGLDRSKWIEFQTFFKHIGIYAFRSSIFGDLVKLRPVEIELSESLEQLRWLYNGYRIKAIKTKYYGVSVDTPEDLEKANSILNTVYE